MSGVVFQGPCPFCSSSDAYTDYGENGFHCFSCGRHSNGNAYSKLSSLNTPQKEVNNSNSECPPLPEDSCLVLNECTSKGRHIGYLTQRIPLQWLHKYGITDAEIEEHTFMWSASKQLLIFPIYKDNELVMHQGRYFGTNSKFPKYIIKGKKDSHLHILKGPRDDRIVLTEDLISAIKVSRVNTAMPLWGSYLSADLAKRIASQYENALLWLDLDKSQYSVKACFEHCMRLNMQPIITTQDPKVFSTDEIKHILEDSKGD